MAEGGWGREALEAGRQAPLGKEMSEPDLSAPKGGGGCRILGGRSPANGRAGWRGEGH